MGVEQLEYPPNTFTSGNTGIVAGRKNQIHQVPLYFRWKKALTKARQPVQKNK